MNYYCDFNEHIRNQATFWELVRNTMGTYWKQTKKTAPIPKSKKLKTKTIKPSHWLHAIFISKPICNQP